MSTTFGVKIHNVEEIQQIAYRSNGGMWIWSGKHGFILAQVLPDETPVIAIDNSPQGIDTLGDIKREILEQEAKK